MTCRNQLMNEGKPYGKSSCEDCGSILFNRLCPQGVKPNPPAGSTLDERHYVPTEAPVTEKYAIIWKDTVYIPGTEGDERSRTNPGHGYPAQPGYEQQVDKFETFVSLEAMKVSILRNSKNLRPKAFTAIKYTELKVSTEVVIGIS